MSRVLRLSHSGRFPKPKNTNTKKRSLSRASRSPPPPPSSSSSSSSSLSYLIDLQSPFSGSNFSSQPLAITFFCARRDSNFKHKQNLDVTRAVYIRARENNAPFAARVGCIQRFRLVKICAAFAHTPRGALLARCRREAATVCRRPQSTATTAATAAAAEAAKKMRLSRRCITWSRFTLIAINLLIACLGVATVGSMFVIWFDSNFESRLRASLTNKNHQPARHQRNQAANSNGCKCE